MLKADGVCRRKGEIMQFRKDAPVYTADGQDVGRIDRVVLDPRTDEITHIVVRKGWLFTEDKVVPVSLIDSATEERVQLRADADKLDDLPEFEETRYIVTDERKLDAAGELDTTPYAAPLYWYPPTGAAWAGYYYGGPYTYPALPYVRETELNIPEGTVGLKEGAEVISADDERVGTVEQVLTNSELNRATHLLISEGWLFPEKRTIPVDWIREVEEDRIYLAVSARELERVPAYQP